MAKKASPLRATAIMRRPTAIDFVCPSAKPPAGPASIQVTLIASRSHHAGL
jgi:hypothetical protein